MQVRARLSWTINLCVIELPRRLHHVLRVIDISPRMSTAFHDICTWLLINAIAQPLVVWISIRVALGDLRKPNPVLSGIRAADFASHPFITVEDGQLRYLAGASHPLPWKFALSPSLFWPGWLLMFSLSGLMRLSGAPLLLSIAVGLNAGLVILLPAMLYLKKRTSRWLHDHLAALPPDARPDVELGGATIEQIA